MSAATTYATRAVMMLVCAVLFSFAAIGAGLTGSLTFAAVGGSVAFVCLFIACRFARQCRNLFNRHQ
ncbi:MAG: hypothetical protein JWO82_1663 [Akkermansiaceae bacterium]|nr:hypothetical protein [Akkermansiaceae bacterium]